MSLSGLPALCQSVRSSASRCAPLFSTQGPSVCARSFFYSSYPARPTADLRQKSFGRIGVAHHGEGRADPPSAGVSADMTRPLAFGATSGAHGRSAESEKCSHLPVSSLSLSLSLHSRGLPSASSEAAVIWFYS